LKKKFIANLLLLITLNLLIKPFWVFGIECKVQNIVGSGEYGFYFSLLSFSLLFNIILDLGITNYNNRSLSQDPTLIKRHFLNIVVVRLLLAVFYGVIVFLIALLSGYDHRQMWLLTVLILNQFLALSILYLRSNISGLQYYTTDSLLSVLDRSIMIILCSLVIWGNIMHETFRIEWFVYVQSVSYLLAVIILIIVVLFKSGQLSFTFDWTIAFRVIKQSLPFALLVFLMGIYTRFDAVILERILPDGKIQAGIYAQSFRILDAATMFAFLFPSLLLPMFSRILGKREDVVPLTMLSFSLIFIFAITFSLTCFAFSQPIIHLLYHEDNAYSSSVFSILILGFIPISVNYIFGTLLTANGSFKALNYTAGSLAVINILLNLVLIPSHKALGAAVSSLITQSIAAVVQVYICIKILNIKFEMTEVLKYLLFAVLSILTVTLMSKLNGEWVLRFLTTAVLVCAMAIISGVLSVKAILQFVKQQSWGFKV
jgi:O-antigen/teichoic acid export membrane protein